MMTKPILSSLLLFTAATIAFPTAAQDTAQDPAQNADILINAGVEETNTEGMPTGWFSNGNNGTGYMLELDRETAVHGQQSVRLTSTPDREANFAVFAQVVDASAYRGHKLRFTAQVRAGATVSEHLGLWFRVDRDDGTIGFFDNMQDRPITNRAWDTHTIEGIVDANATRITVGVLMTGDGEAWFDDAQLVDMGPVSRREIMTRARENPRLTTMDGDIAASPVSARGLQNLSAFARLYGLVRWFHPSAAAINADWDSVAFRAIPRVENAQTAEQLAQILNDTFAELAPALEVVPGGLDNLPDEAPQSGPGFVWQHFGLGGSSAIYSSARIAIDDVRDGTVTSEALPGGVSFRLPLFTVADAGEAGEGTTAQAADGYGDKPEGWTPSGHDRTTRIAATIEAGVTLEHFYPYWDEVDGDWDAAFDRALAQAAEAADDNAFRSALQRLVSAIDDGHGAVRYPSNINAALPIDWTMIDGNLIITKVGASAAETGLEAGMVVDTINGRSTEEFFADRMAQWSGSDHFVLAMAETTSRYGVMDEALELGVTRGDGENSTVNVSMQEFSADASFASLRPDDVAEIEPGTFYVDLSRIGQADLDAAIERLAEADGVIFDLRGYPRVNTQWLRHLIDEPVRSAKFLKPEFTGPDAEARYDVDGGWNVTPLAPRVTPNIVFLTNATAISYSESILGTVKANGLGIIVGSPTAGANGNVSEVTLPGGYRLRYTGMLVVNRDGTRHHIDGVQPDVLIAPTREGVRQGRDEVFEAGLAIVLGE
ncbi:S41 family peptidase [Erythrobacter sp. Alg231-14]|uniref:S41 family peptidase n=1 Tax=Erythrobacter sp. Alg231-14 TaxID=1922225 RepID=UPI000D55A7AA